MGGWHGRPLSKDREGLRGQACVVPLSLSMSLGPCVFRVSVRISVCVCVCVGSEAPLLMLGWHLLSAVLWVLPSSSTLNPSRGQVRPVLTPHQSHASSQAE